MAAAELRLGQTVDVRNDGGQIIIEPVAAPSYTLEDLLAGMSPDSFPKLVNFGPATGNEAWRTLTLECAGPCQLTGVKGRRWDRAVVR